MGRDAQVGHQPILLSPDLTTQVQPFKRSAARAISCGGASPNKPCRPTEATRSSIGLVPHFQIATTDGVALGARELGGSEWPAGSVIYTCPNDPELRVVRILDTDNDDPEMHFTVLVVEPL
jgi:hypothetical protein